MNDLNTFRLIIEPFVTFFTTIILGGFSASTVVEFIKNKFIPIPATTYPRLTNAVVSVLVTLVAIFVSPVNLVISNWFQVAAFIIGIMVTSAFFYNNVFRDR